MKVYKQGETVVLNSLSTNQAGTLTDPGTSIKVKIIDPTGTVALAEYTMTKSSTGTYVYYYDTTSSSALGVWQYEVVAINSAHTTIESSQFELIARAS